MSDKVTVRMDTSAFIKDLKQYNNMAQLRARKVIKHTAFDVIEEAKRLAPRKYGILMRSIEVLARRVDGFGYDVGSTVKYARALEQPDKPLSSVPIKKGRKEGQYPFLRPAAQNKKIQFVKDLRKALRK